MKKARVYKVWVQVESQWEEGSDSGGYRNETEPHELGRFETLEEALEYLEKLPAPWEEE